ncbi:hypothetical protein S2M10_29610 [Sphingomonas sp. S2M10]|uniref:hypothetical protein n=1 Tax=Sphingomonas sp. S2M10 TaxID=2705010 RepID=UPI0014575914|nr:hypothetical protein [Sphingomonas sp. S2M10]NLS27959.1 hypothetical protein [Sphingomonas sp. S2M10]
MSDEPESPPESAPEQPAPPAAQPLGPRDYFAGQVIATALGKSFRGMDGLPIVDALSAPARAMHVAAAAAYAYQVADAMVLARQEGGAA